MQNTHSQFESVVVRWINLELVTEWSQKEKNKYHTLMHISGIYKRYWGTYLQGRNRGSHLHDTNLRTQCEGREEGEGGTNWETSVDTPRVKQTARGKLLYNPEGGARCSMMTKMGGMGGVWEGGSRGSGYIYTYSWFTLCSRNQHNVVKQLSSN